QLNAFNGFAGTPADAAKLYHVNSAGNTQYALVAMHVISKLAPNWTWATFEHKDNPGRCDVIGCKDAFGAQQAFLPPISAVESKQHYPDCVKTAELAALFAHANLDPDLRQLLSQRFSIRFHRRDGTGITCHGRAAVDETGKMTSLAGFGPISIQSAAHAERGRRAGRTVRSQLVLVPGGPPSFPVLANEADISRIAMAVDFIWSIAFRAIDDTANPPQTTSRFCANK
ncbi:MAG TPA: hypothetical protein VGJ26_04365, partial [Pirellulales bacterium]